MPLGRVRHRRSSASESESQRRRAEEQARRERQEVEDDRDDQLRVSGAAITNRANELGLAIIGGQAVDWAGVRALLDADYSTEPYADLTYLRFQYNARLARGG